MNRVKSEGMFNYWFYSAIPSSTISRDIPHAVQVGISTNNIMYIYIYMCVCVCMRGTINQVKG